MNWRVMGRFGFLAALSLVVGLPFLGCAAPSTRGQAAAPASAPVAVPAAPTPTTAPVASASQYIREHYAKREAQIPMRDGVRLFTAIYTPKDASQKYPILMIRTPYSVGPYGETNFPDLYPSALGFLKEGYIFVLQDVRGRWMSEGTFVNMTPHLPNKRGPADIDESTDTYDTIEWLLKNVPDHNGRVGQMGISYPGFYSSAGMIDAHPALKAVSPQAPIADWFFDDFFHHGAFFLPHAFIFLNGFGRPRPAPTTQRATGIEPGTPDGYQFFLDLGPLKNADARYFHGDVAFWNEIAAHPNYDEFWQKRNLLPHLKHVAPAVMTVGGWFDAEDLYGAVQTYQAIERQNPGIFNVFVMGPWRHGGWGRGDGDHLGSVGFGDKTGVFYRETIELPFFNHFLKDKGDPHLPEAYLFETGANHWRKFDRWPPPDAEQKDLYFHADGRLAFEPPNAAGAYDEFVSDPNRPVPYTEAHQIRMNAEYMIEDQRFAARRPDVLTYQTEPLTADLTLVGPVLADLWVSTSGTDSDWVVKLIDVYPGGTTELDATDPERELGGYQMLVRSEVIRGRFRDGYETPKPFAPNEPTRVDLPLQDVLHTFRAGHRIMVQVQCTWFPLVDRNPQKFVNNIFQADEGDFSKATQRVYRSKEQPTHLRVGIWKARN